MCICFGICCKDGIGIFGFWVFLGWKGLCFFIDNIVFEDLNLLLKRRNLKCIVFLICCLKIK